MPRYASLAAYTELIQIYGLILLQIQAQSHQTSTKQAETARRSPVATSKCLQLLLCFGNGRTRLAALDVVGLDPETVADGGPYVLALLSKLRHAVDNGNDSEVNVYGTASWTLILPTVRLASAMTPIAKSTEAFTWVSVSNIPFRILLAASELVMFSHLLSTWLTVEMVVVIVGALRNIPAPNLPMPPKKSMPMSN